MAYQAKIICDSINSYGVRLTTFEVAYPHFVHKDMLTHRMLSRNFQSFRAYPPEKIINQILIDPVIPEIFYERAKGMIPGDPLDNFDEVTGVWWEHITHTVNCARAALKLGVSKDQVNQMLQDLTWITGVITATDWDNFWNLRMELNEDARPKARTEVYKIVSMMHEEYRKGIPTPLRDGDWHLPYITDDDFPWALETSPEDAFSRLRKLSTARCGRVSYLTHDGKRDPEKDIALHDLLLRDMHMSPFEHVARPSTYTDLTEPKFFYEGNFRSWHQYRKDILNEANYARH